MNFSALHERALFSAHMASKRDAFRSDHAGTHLDSQQWRLRVRQTHLVRPYILQITKQCKVYVHVFKGAGSPFLCDFTFMHVCSLAVIRVRLVYL